MYFKVCWLIRLLLLLLWICIKNFWLSVLVELLILNVNLFSVFRVVLFLNIVMLEIFVFVGIVNVYFLGLGFVKIYGLLLILFSLVVIIFEFNEFFIGIVLFEDVIM